MKEFIKSLRQYIIENPIRFDDDWDHPALDSLYWHYGETYAMNSDKTKAISSTLQERLHGLSYQEKEDLFNQVGLLCAEHERVAFCPACSWGRS